MQEFELLIFFTAGIDSEDHFIMPKIPPRVNFTSKTFSVIKTDTYGIQVSVTLLIAFVTSDKCWYQRWTTLVAKSVTA